MKTIRRLALVTSILLFCAVICRGWIYRQLVSYHANGTRADVGVHSEALIGFLETHTPKDQMDIERIIETSLYLTSSTLSFTAAECEKNPNLLISTAKTNCIGYAAFFSTVCNHLLAKSDLDREWSAQARIGQLYCLGRNVHPYLRSAFFRDHDFVLLRNKLTGQVLAVDPTLADYTGIRNVKVIGPPRH